RFLTVSFHPAEAERQGWKIKWWDFWFYISFGVAVTISVPLAGVLMVFTMLVVPATIAFLFTRDIKKLVIISWGSGALASLLGLWVSYVADLPTGPLIVCMYGLVLAAAARPRYVSPRATRAPRDRSSRSRSEARSRGSSRRPGLRPFSPDGTTRHARRADPYAPPASPACNAGEAGPRELIAVRRER